MATKVDVSHNFWRARAIRRVTKERRREKERRVGEERRRGEGGEKERKRGGGKGFVVELEENPGAAARAKVPPVPVRKLRAARPRQRNAQKMIVFSLLLALEFM
jgi:hypothetical protein